MQILVVGGTRFIGAHTVRTLSASGHDVTVLHRGRNEAELPASVHHIRDEAAAYPIARYPDAVRKTAWDVVVHMVLMGEMDAKAVVQEFTGRAGRLVAISSGDVYRAYGRLTRKEPGEPEPLPLHEQSPLRSVLFPYRGQEKRLGSWASDYEKILVERALQESTDLNWTILRLPKVYGREDNRDLATVYGFAQQPQWRWTHGYVANVAAAITLAATFGRATCRTYNVGEETTPTMGERLSRLPMREAGVQGLPPFEFGQSIVYDTSAIRAELGYREPYAEDAAMRAIAEGGLPEGADN